MRQIAALLFLLCPWVTTAAPHLVFNANGYTLDAKGQLQKFSTLVFNQGKVVATGDAALKAKYNDALLINAQGKTLLPGLIDAHGHLLELGATLLQVDVRDLGSAEASVALVHDYAQKHPELPWITGRGWNQVLWPDKQFPTAKQLDVLIADRPVFLERVDAHAAWVNTKALALAGIDDTTPDPEGGQIVRDSNGKATGVLIDNAMALVIDKLPSASVDTYSARLTAAGEHLLGLGVTSMHDAGVSQAVSEFYRERAKAHTLPIRVYAMLSAKDPQLSNMLQQGPFSSDDDFISIRSVKAYGDGALGSRGAALLAPYQDQPTSSGLLLTPVDSMPTLFDQVIGKNFQLNYHAIGDRANRLALDQFEKSFNAVGGKQLRHRIEHAQVIHTDDIPRFKALKIIPSMQPTHATSDMNMAEDRVGKARLAGAYAWQTFLKQGSPLAFGSDFPVELANPFFGLHAAVTRQDRNNQPKQGWRPEQAISIEQAFKAFTQDAAFAAHQEDKIGRLLPGMWADFILIDQDIFKIKAEDIWKAQVVETWIAGVQRFRLQDS